VDVAIDFYRDYCIPVMEEVVEIDWKELQTGTVAGFTHMGFWKAVLDDQELSVNGETVQLR
jgi:hypothetical protein